MSLQEFIGEYKYSRVPEEFPDPSQFPLYYKARKHVFEIGPGQALFIPAGWFHFVYSTDVTDGLNFAINFWYDSIHNWQRGEKSKLLPRTIKHDINVEPTDILKEDAEIKCVRSTLNGLFPPDRLSHIYKGHVTFPYMTFKEFIDTKNPRYYLSQAHFDNTKVKDIPYPTTLYMKSLWLNFGNIRTLCHFDEHDNFLCQVKGKKRVILFPHEDRHLLYMYNPTPMPVIKEIMRLTLTFGTITQVTFKEYKDTYKINDVFRETLENYKNQVGKLPFFNQPTEFKTIDTKGKIYFHEEYDNKYPLRMIWIIEGYGEFTTFETKKTLNPGNIIMLPTGLPFFWRLNGNLKFITHV
jgi:quercetin dioxygenase-like cupin family protein